MDAKGFDYATAFSRNIGWVVPEEQAILRAKRIAIAGLGGVGGSHLLTLTRLGIGRFHLADPDVFENVNFNRQAGAYTSTLGRPKAEVLAEMARDINPELRLKTFITAIDESNVDEFLDNVDLYVDGIDFFAVDARRTVFAACEARGIPAITVAPLGMGAALLNFLPGHMGFEAYFRLEGHDTKEQLLRFLLGLSPAAVHARYLVDPSAINLPEHRGPSTAMACELCAGIAGTQAVKILLNRGPVVAAPRGLQFDAYANRLHTSWRPWGNANPLQRLTLRLARRRMAGGAASRRTRELPADPGRSTVERILDAARWAPSGDNAQPWRFVIDGDRHVIVHGHDTRGHCIYDRQGHASWLAMGALLENIVIAAHAHGLQADIQRRNDAPDFDVRLRDAPDVTGHELWPYMTARSVQRRPLSRRPLTAVERRRLGAAAGDEFEIKWFAGWRRRLRVAWLYFYNAGIRLTLPEAYATHREAIAWNSRYSDDRLPDQALGAGAATLRVMRWAMTSWSRVRFLNRFLAGTLLPRLEMDLLPGWACGAHFVLLARRRPESVDDFVAAGRAVQRFWLTATQLGLQLQPQLTPLVFDRYLQDDIEFTANRRAMRRARRMARRLRALLGAEDCRRAVFMGRIGAGPAALSRSTRRPLDALISRSTTTVQDARHAPRVAP